MNGFPLDHLQRLVVILYSDMFAIYICMELFKSKAHEEAFSLYVSISGFNISQGLAGKSYGSVILEETSAETIFTGISLQDKGLGAVLCKAVWLLVLFSLMSRGNLLKDCLGTAIHNCSSSGSLFFATLRQNN